MNNPLELSGKCTVLVVDDTPDNLSLMSNLLRTDYKVKLATSGERALQIVAGESKPDLILLDIMMPEMDGYEVLRRLQFNPETEDIPVIFLTAMSAADDESVGLELGAVDYITKPINPAIVMARVRNHLQLKRARDFLAHHNNFLEQEIANRTRALAELQDATIRAMASLAETRDNETGNHIRRTQHYVEALARKLQDHPRFKDELTDAAIETIFKSAPLHDIGKVGIPDRILLKPGKLTPEEFEIMKTHTTLGRDAIVAAETDAMLDNPFFRYAKEITYSHQEKWDGSGYPEGLMGNTIPLSARLMAVADVYDALISERVYKSAFTHETAVEIIRDGRGSHFDPDMVDAFLVLSEEFRAIAQRFADSAPVLQAQVERLAADVPAERIELTVRDE
ncbi:MAG: two-component system response regulator [Gammaproteobacteria bacterium]|jgi:putative two-component system response regulator|nr:two-component system response regulator [Gammaproteobacteria bacterium]MBU0829603.1 two-component system response regulator [Gammaproteobacteria bacterium]MBU0889825.1 two-component system response regulator [Gammaproteobacteria bacterium]MBU1816365.1 two-component system response regulator [Gammaproteobacteria bacterium]